MKSVVVTGSSTGIGWGIAKVLIGKGFRVFGSVRKVEDGERLRKEFGPNFVPLYFDVTDAAAVAKGADQVAAALGGEMLCGLVNNAGIAVAGPLLYVKIDEFRHQIEVNLTGQLIVTQAFAPLLGADQDRTGASGRIVMISSVGGQNGSPFVGPYAASKFALEGYSQSLRRELMLFGVDVIVIGPGAIATPIWDKAEGEDLNRFSNTPYAPMMARVADYMVTQGKKGLPPGDVGALIWKCLTDPKPKTRYAILRNEFMDRTLPRMMNPRAVDKIIAKRLGFPEPS